MKKIILFSAIACSVALFYACKKDSTTTTTPPTKDSSDIIDPVALSAAIKVGYGATSITGEMPATSTEAAAPKLQVEGYDNRIYNAISNRYVIIYPQSSTGYVAGYYVKINGAGSYFKIDYSKASGLRKANHHGLREEGDNADSSIVIKLPAGLKGDTFSIKYAAYDTLNRVSNTLTAIVSLVTTDSTSNSLLAGNWKSNRYKYNDNEWAPQIYSSDSLQQNFNCADGRLQPGCSLDFCIYLTYERSVTTANYMIFSANNQYAERYVGINDSLNIDSSTCSKLVYDTIAYEDVYSGGYSYNATTKEFILIYDGHNDKDQGSNISTYRYTVSELSATKIVYYEKSVNGNKLSFDYYEYLKQ
jgi:hypothetical protein